MASKVVRAGMPAVLTGAVLTGIMLVAGGACADPRSGGVTEATGATGATGAAGDAGDAGNAGNTKASGSEPGAVTDEGGTTAEGEAERSRCGDRKLSVIAHRGASDFRPEHTLASYRLAIRMGADYIELDLVPTKDHVLVARHENELSRTTDVADHPEFADRRTTKTINGHQRAGWFTEDFTLDELRTLRTKERYPRRRPHNRVYDGRERIPTLDEAVTLAQRRGVGVYAEIKYSTYFASIGLPVEKPLLETFARHGWKDGTAPVFIQSFETKNLRDLRSATRLRLIQLIGRRGTPYDLAAAGERRTYDDLATPEGLRRIAEYADAVGVMTSRILPAGSDGRLGTPTSFVEEAHRQGLQVLVATIHDENAGLPVEYRRGDPGRPAYRRAVGDAASWVERLYTLGVDGVFANDPATARLARERLCGEDH
ncbi:glycerophosphodiester phosphodiesterase family protein [Streptosporangium sp. NPDC051022]|uniref:glycerophosphodiester phosphodiesterase family protein n=1 Tax=Streptosporangium sp. NPDC051022 TaxID=3155752 RepID=UPI003441772B